VPEAFQLHRNMGCTRAEFIGWLPGATRPASFQIDGDKVTVITHGGRVQISLEEKPPRRMGLLAVPVLGVTFCFLGLDELTRDDFLVHFDSYTMRGGG
jgi:hypothetical protein